MYPDKKYYKKIIKSFSSNFKFSYGPEYLVIDVTNVCNCRCYGCWIYSENIIPSDKDKLWRSQFIPFKYVKQLIKNLASLGTKEIRITGGGEPFVHPQIMEIISLIKKKGMRCDVTTNFTLMTIDKIHTLIDLGIDNLTLSLWAGDAKTYAKTHPKQSEKIFNQIRENLHYLSTRRDLLKTKIVIANVLSNLNYDKVDEMLLFAKKMFVDEVYFTLIDPIVGKTDQFLLNQEEQNELISTFERVHHSIDSYPFKIDNIDHILRRINSSEANKGNYDKNILSHIHCYAGWNFARILGNGDIAPCCKGVVFPMGNIKKNSFKKIWNSKAYRNFREKSYHLKDELVSKVECYKTCDNLMQNIEADNIIKEIQNESK